MSQRDRRRFPRRQAPRLGCRADLWLSGRRHQRPPGIAQPGRERARADPGPPRGDGGVHGLRTSQVQRTAGSLPCHVRPRRHPPAERSIRRQARSSAGGCDCRAAGPALTRRELPAGSRSRFAVQGRGARIRGDGDRPGADAAHPRPRDADRHRPAHGDLRHPPRQRCLAGRRA